ncbi:TonB-dependent receptor plug domain-containing protein [bacterium]|nr:TonB-dependent receptor plug domain-containing protein [bacterium]
MRIFAKLFCTASLLFISAYPVLAQKFTISGYISDSSNNEQLIGASIYVTDIKEGTATNAFGFYSLTLPAGQYHVVYSYVGYSSKSVNVNLTENKTLSVALSPSISLNEVVITDERTNQIQEKSQMSTITITMDKVKTLPALMGEKDLIKTLQLLPGVQSGGEGSSGLYVRGGGPDQNLILLDGVPVYNASHLFGFFSVFNADAINNVELIKGGFPARYGGRLSSVLDIHMKEGNMNKLEGEGSIGVISSKLSLQGPIKKGKTSFIVSGRRTYIDVLARPIIKAVGKSQGGNIVAGYYFYDLNGKINHKFSDRSRLYLSTYMGNDKFYFNVGEKYYSNGHENTFKTKGDLAWGNRIAAVRWNYMINPKLFSNTTITYSKYKFSTGMSLNQIEWDGDKQVSTEYFSNFYSGIDDATAKVDFDYMPNPNHFIKFGAGDIYHTFSPGATQTKISSYAFRLDSTIASNKLYAHELYGYIEDDFKIGNRLKVNLGAYATAFNPKDTTFFSVQPRFSARYLIGPKSSLKASYATMMQALHLLTNPTIGLPTDLWLPATKRVPVEYSKQVAMGYAQTIHEGYELSIEGYYKSMSNLIEYKDGESYSAQNTGWEDKVELGKGWSYGAEVFFEKKLGKVTGWVGYTLSWTNRQFANLNYGKIFPYRYDRRHDISVVVTYKPNDHVDFGLVWVYGTGNAYTLGLERYWAYNDNVGKGDYNYNQEITQVESRNNFRAPAYHRLDLGVNVHKPTKWGERTLSMGLYNAYSRQNPFYIYWGYTDGGFFGGDSQRVLKQVALFPMIPSISYSFKF